MTCADPADQPAIEGDVGGLGRLAPFLHGGGEHQRHRVVGPLGQLAVEVVQRRARPELPLEARWPCGTSRIRRNDLSMITAQLQTEARSSRSMTALVNRSAWQEQLQEARPGRGAGQPHGVDRGVLPWLADPFGCGSGGFGSLRRRRMHRAYGQVLDRRSARRRGSYGRGDAGCQEQRPAPDG